MFEFYRTEGTPWWVSMPLGADADIVIPRPSNRGVMASQSGERNLEEYRIILLGYHYDFVGSDGTGFDLEFTDNQVTPAVARTIISVRIATIAAVSPADTVDKEGGCPFCFIPGPAGAYSPIENGATLRLNVTGTAPSSGRLLCWGIHVPADWAPGKQFTGSPIVF